MTNKSQEIARRIRNDNGRYWAGDNISQWLEPGDKQELIEELTVSFYDNPRICPPSLDGTVAVWLFVCQAVS